MANVARTRKILPNAFLLFLEKGQIVTDGSPLTVSELVKPDYAPPENWDTRPCTLEFDIEREIQEEKVLCPSELGGWRNETESFVIGAKLMFTEKTWTENYERLLWGLPAKVAAATPQTPFTGAPEIEGWLKIIERDRAGVIIVHCDVWGMLRLKGGTKVDGKPSRPQYEFEVINTALNTWTAPV